MSGGVTEKGRTNLKQMEKKDKSKLQMKKKKRHIILLPPKSQPSAVKIPDLEPETVDAFRLESKFAPHPIPEVEADPSPKLQQCASCDCKFCAKHGLFMGNVVLCDSCGRDVRMELVKKRLEGKRVTREKEKKIAAEKKKSEMQKEAKCTCFDDDKNECPKHGPKCTCYEYELDDCPKHGPVCRCVAKKTREDYCPIHGYENALEWA